MKQSVPLSLTISIVSAAIFNLNGFIFDPIITMIMYLTESLKCESSHFDKKQKKEEHLPSQKVLTRKNVLIR